MEKRISATHRPLITLANFWPLGLLTDSSVRGLWSYEKAPLHIYTVNLLPCSANLMMIYMTSERLNSQVMCVATA